MAHEITGEKEFLAKWHEDFPGGHKPSEPTPLSEEELVLLRMELSDDWAIYPRTGFRLLATIDRLRAENAALRQRAEAAELDLKDANETLDGLMIVCPGCSKAGGADRAVHHLPPACKED